MKLKPSILSTLTLLCTLFFPQVSAYPNGLVQSSCISMEPTHGAVAQTSTAPYTLTVSNSSYTSGEKLTVTLSGISGAQMKGFLIQARAGSSTTPLGSFQTSNSYAQTLTCTTAASSVSHTSSSKMSSIQMTWVAPSSNISDIQIRATVVQSLSIYWTNVVSPTFTYASISPDTGSTNSTGTNSNGTVSTGTNSTGTNSTGTNSTGTGSTGTNSTSTNSTATNSTGANSTGAGSTGTNSTVTGSTGTNSTVTGSTGTNSVGTNSSGCHLMVSALSQLLLLLTSALLAL